MKRSIIPFMVIILSVAVVQGTYISMTTQLDDVVIQDGMGKTTVRLNNLGDEAAHEVDLSLLLPEGFSGEGTYLGKFNPHEPRTETLTIKSEGEKKKGLYPGALIVGYKDANLYPFSAITPLNIIVGERTQSPIFGMIEEATLKGKKETTLTLRLKNNDPEPHQIRVRLYLPRELSASETMKTAMIEGNGEATVKFKVASFSALSGSSYNIVASAHYIDKDHSYNSFTNGLVKIEEDQPLFKSNLLYVLIVLLVILFIALQFRKE